MTLNYSIPLIYEIKEFQMICTIFSPFMSFQNLIQVTVEKYGRIDCLINNAGTRELIFQAFLLDVKDSQLSIIR